MSWCLQICAQQHTTPLLDAHRQLWPKLYTARLRLECYGNALQHNTVCLKAEITQELGQVRKYGQKKFPKAVEFLEQPAIASGPQLSTAVRISAADKFPTIADLVGEAVPWQSRATALLFIARLDAGTKKLRKQRLS